MNEIMKEHSMADQSVTDSRAGALTNSKAYLALSKHRGFIGVHIDSIGFNT